MLKAIIIDDVKKIRESLSDMLSRYCPDITVIDEAESVATGLQKIQLQQPDLVFLDIEMPDGTGFDLLQKLSSINFKIIFVTAYEEYAVKAFKFSAVDYILKPVDKDELIEAVKKAEVAIEKENLELKLKTLFLNIENTKNQPRKLVLRTSERIYSIDISDIIRCESDKNYTEFFLNDGKKLLVSITLKEYDEMLSPYGFFRSHQSHLINLRYFDHYLKSDGGMAIMKDKSSVPVSSRKKDELLILIEKL